MNPLSVGNSQSERTLRLSWPDGRESLFNHAELRRQCPCSQCRAFRLKAVTPRVDERVRLIEINPQGYGVQLVFSDGHQRGIYPWDYLAQLSS
ncbi:DUF971 domain-containing protein [Pseudomonas sp. MD195_PC81_125]|uniref:DUF971 domain-containing protein n=1 Tax=Pseudomonas sp. MD195_PC81_125 TaxID=2741560 RepID=UPI0015FC279C|nr:DUF971 domain-containing protein [Pseudomonas sp. MD195_PC81_125]MBA5982530.1 DUF971 domain-containing protein [Pseudomonas sp. MD195_PC81_125]